MNINTMVEHYLVCALWSSLDDNGNPYEDRYSRLDITKDSRLQVVADCQEFVKRAGDLLENWDSEQAGHDFWLSRNGHGAGFFDRTHIADKGTCDKLQDIARSFGNVDIMPHGKVSFTVS